MAYWPKFAERRAYERRLTGDGTLRSRAGAVILMGVGMSAMGFVAGDAFFLTVGLIGIVSGGFWRLWLTLPNP